MAEGVGELDHDWRWHVPVAYSLAGQLDHHQVGGVNCRKHRCCLPTVEHGLLAKDQLARSILVTSSSGIFVYTRTFLSAQCGLSAWPGFQPRLSIYTVCSATTGRGILLLTLPLAGPLVRAACDDCELK